MTEGTSAKRKVSVVRVLLMLGILLLFLFACLIPEFIVNLFQLAGLVLFGWVGFLKRVGSEVQLDPTGILVGFGALVFLIIGIQSVISQTFPDRAWKPQQTIRGVIGATGLFVGGICMVGLGHELAWSRRPKPPWIEIGNTWDSFRSRQQSQANLRRIGASAANYEGGNGQFPVGGGFRPDGTAEHGWMTALLPQIDQAALHTRIQLELPWYHPSNRDAFATRIPVFEYRQIRGRPVLADGYASTFFAANDQLLNANRSFKINEITDGISTTVFAGEVADNLRPWGDVVNWRRLELGINGSPHGFGRPDRSGAQFVFVDGSTRMISNNIDAKVLKALATPNAGDTVGDY